LTRLLLIALILAQAAALAAAKRVVSLSPAMTELVCQLGAKDSLAGRSTACDFPPDVTALPTAGDFASPDMERILALHADLVLSNDLVKPQVAHALRQHGVEVFNFQVNSLDDYSECVRRLGTLLGCESQATQELQRVADCAAFPPTGRKVLLVIWENPLIIAGENTFPTALLRHAGFDTPDLDGNAGYFTPATEWLRTQKLDAIVTLLPQTSLTDLPCPVLAFPAPDLLQRPGPRWTEGVSLLHEILACPPSQAEPPPPPANLTSLRLWRLAAAFAVGGILTLAGLLFQTIFRNPLATPYTLGISSGAATGAALAFIVGNAALLPFLVPASAFCGALLTLAIVLLASRHDRENSDSLLLCGVITGVVLSSLLIYLISIADSAELAGVTWWTLGDLQCLPPYGIVALLLLLAAGTVLAQWHANDLNALLLGEETAQSLGVNPRRLRLLLIVTASLLTALAVSLAGIIGFVGLIVPHLARKLFTANHRRLIIPATIGGGLFLLACDQLARLLNFVRQTPVGVVTSIIGGLLFLGLLSRRKF